MDVTPMPADPAPTTTIRSFFRSAGCLPCTPRESARAGAQAWLGAPTTTQPHQVLPGAAIPNACSSLMLHLPIHMRAQRAVD
eukprot:366074-Chlamydomonas_euryale.AAC.14